MMAISLILATRGPRTGDAAYIHRSTGLDMLHPLILCTLEDKLLDLTHTFNNSVETKTVPEDCEIS